MSEKELFELSDQELLVEAEKVKSSTLIHAILIGFLVGIVVYSIVKNTWGFLTLIPLFLVYKLVNKSNNARNKALKKILKERDLK